MTAEHAHRFSLDWVDGKWRCIDCGVEEPQVTTPRLVNLGDRQRAVYHVLADHEWHDGPELTHPSVGGSEGLRRLRELRAKGFVIEKRIKAKGKTTRQYRLAR